MSQPVVQGMKQAAYTAAADVRVATDFVGVTMDYHLCDCGGYIPAGEVYCAKCGRPRPGYRPSTSQDDPTDDNEFEPQSEIMFAGPATGTAGERVEAGVTCVVHGSFSHVHGVSLCTRL
eukprot:UN1511